MMGPRDGPPPGTVRVPGTPSLEAFIPERLQAGEMVSAFMDVLQIAEEEAAGAEARIQELAVQLPIELELEVEGGRVSGIRASPPTQRTETTVMPVLHGLRLRGEVVYGG